MLTINIDGASRGNPGPSGIGILIFRNNNLILNYGEFIGFQSNLLSEYIALKRALQFALNIDDELSIHTDSMTISYKYIPRHKNTYVDLIAKKAIDYHIK